MGTRATFERFFAAVSGRDRATVEAMLHPEFTITEAPSLPYAGRYDGAEGWRRLNRAVAAAWSNLAVEVTEIFGETPDALVVRMSMSGTAPGGATFTTSILEIWRFEGERIREITPYYFDTHHLVALHARA
jgi:ketosteroid isomerase-like protein